MSRQERARPGRPETRVLRVNLAVEEAVRRMFAYGLLRKRQKGASSTSDEAVRGSDWGRAGTAGADGPGSRRMQQ